MSTLDPLPDHPHLVPYLAVSGAAEAIAFYVRAFGARELYRLDDPSGRVSHAELEVGRARLMLADEHPEIDHRGPLRLGGSAVLLQLYVSDVDATVARAVEAGATLVRAPSDQFYGERVAQLRDPFGHRWSLASRIEAVSADEVRSRYAAMMSAGAERGVS